MRRIQHLCFAAFCVLATQVAPLAAAEKQFVTGHPRLYFTADELPRLRALRESGMHAKIWANLTRSANWCAQQPVRQEWIPTIVPDPQFENLYDRFYATMHDTAIVEQLAFASTLSDPTNDPYFESARNWLLAASKVWRNEATNAPDASKAYAVLRIMKALAVSYDMLYERLSESDRKEVRDTLVAVGTAYYPFFQAPATAGAGYNKHHGSVDAAPFGVMALALLGEVDESSAWLDNAVEKHVNYLLPYALTPSGTNDQSSNFWASTLHYRIFFCDPLRRITGRDLFAEFPQSLPGRIALAAVAGQQPATLEFNENNRSVLFAPTYGQIDYWSPALVYLARHHKRPIYQYLALWDESLGSIQHTRFITPTRKEELLFCLGPYAYIWCDPEIAPAVEGNLPLSFEFSEPEVNEAYLRASYEPGGIVVGMRKGAIIIHAGGRPIFVDQLEPPDNSTPAEPVDEMLVADDGRGAFIRCVGPKVHEIGEQLVKLERPSRLTMNRQCSKPITWWCASDLRREENSFMWPDGTRLSVRKGTIVEVNLEGLVEKLVHFGGMKWADPHSFTYPTIKVEPADGQIALEVVTPDSSGDE
jgi:hypothetical protein